MQKRFAGHHFKYFRQAQKENEKDENKTGQPPILSGSIRNGSQTEKFFGSGRNL